MTKPITIPPTAEKLWNTLRKAGAKGIELFWRDGADVVMEGNFRVTVWWSSRCDEIDTVWGPTVLLAIRGVIQKAKKRGKM